MCVSLVHLPQAISAGIFRKQIANVTIDSTTSKGNQKPNSVNVKDSVNPKSYTASLVFVVVLFFGDYI